MDPRLKGEVHGKLDLKMVSDNAAFLLDCIDGISGFYLDTSTGVFVQKPLPAVPLPSDASAVGTTTVDPYTGEQTSTDFLLNYRNPRTLPVLGGLRVRTAAPVTGMQTDQEFHRDPPSKPDYNLYRISRFQGSRERMAESELIDYRPALGPRWELERYPAFFEIFGNQDGFPGAAASSASWRFSAMVTGGLVFSMFATSSVEPQNVGVSTNRSVRVDLPSRSIVFVMIKTMTQGSKTTTMTDRLLNIPILP